MKEEKTSAAKLLDAVIATFDPHMDIPKDKNYPADAAQCDGCGGWGCAACGDRGWVPPDHGRARKCHRDECGKLIPPTQVAVYCSNECAFLDA